MDKCLGLRVTVAEEQDPVNRRTFASWLVVVVIGLHIIIIFVMTWTMSGPPLWHFSQQRPTLHQ